MMSPTSSDAYCSPSGGRPSRPGGRLRWVAAQGQHVAPRLAASRLTRCRSSPTLCSTQVSPGVQEGLRCGPLTVPNHKLVPDSRWILDAPASRVIPRRSRGAAPAPRGVALVSLSRYALFKHAWTSDGLAADPDAPAGWARVATGDFYSAYANCYALAALVDEHAGAAAVGDRPGLPYVFNADENSHFVPRAIGMFGHSLNPKYLITRLRTRTCCTCILAVVEAARPSATPSRPTRRPRSRSRACCRPCSAPRRSASWRGRPAPVRLARGTAGRRAAGGRRPARPLRPWRSTTMPALAPLYLGLVGVAEVYQRVR